MIDHGTVIVGSVAVMLARVLDASGNPIVQADIESITVTITDISTGEVVGSPLTPSVASVVFNAIQTDARWTMDNLGYNVSIPIAGSYFPAGDTTYAVAAVFTPASGPAFTAAWRIQCVDPTQ